ncbi:META domain-containing protein [Hymenobacter sp. ASUV-10]|uniref:META domain-containing protein n=1 Tax=Hymenobacter aranciens TaxID=3063996 RepID=A0ABT9BCW3_9BACT|nr:META domain-containing protein [Hymenobacter sp. ASUV-10]MDO7876105.1 META domain-containing protein [Hymenobacter sp. ASUV-10]
MRYFLLLALAATACQTKPTQEASTVPAWPAAPLRNTRWVPREIGSQPVSIPDNTQEPYLLLRPEGSAEGNAGCNRFRGEATAEGGDGLRFGALLTTRMACPALATETAFTKALEQTRHYRISGDTLRLYDASNGLLTRLEAVYLQ